MNTELIIYSFGGALTIANSNNSTFTERLSYRTWWSFSHSSICPFRHDLFGTIDAGVRTLYRGALYIIIAISALSPTRIDVKVRKKLSEFNHLPWSIRTFIDVSFIQLINRSLSRLCASEHTKMLTESRWQPCGLINGDIANFSPKTQWRNEGLLMEKASIKNLLNLYLPSF